jgi:hypothetical protein
MTQGEQSGVAGQFHGNGIDQVEYLEVLNDLYSNYAQGEEYLTMSALKREAMFDRYKEIKHLVRSVFIANTPPHPPSNRLYINMLHE